MATMCARDLFYTLIQGGSQAAVGIPIISSFMDNDLIVMHTVHYY